MAMLLDYGQKTVTVAPFKVVNKVLPATNAPNVVNRATPKKVSYVANVTTQIREGIATKPLATALKPSQPITVVKIPTVLQASVTPTKTATTINAVNKTTNQQAITTLVNSLMGQKIRASPNFQKVFATIQTKQLLGAIYNKGYELAPKGTNDYLANAELQAATFRDQYSVLYGINEELVARQKTYADTESQLKIDLSKQANQATVYQGQLENLQGQYSDLQKAYQDLLANPPQKDDLLGGIGNFLSTYGIWIALGVGAIILLPSVMRIFERR